MLNGNLNNPADSLNLALMAGEIMLQSGAETARVEDTMRRLLNNCGYDKADSFVTTTGLFAGLNVGEQGAMTAVRRVKISGNNFEKVARVNDMSRRFASGQLTVQEALIQLEKIASPVKLPFLVGLAACGVACFAFCYIFYGSIPDCSNAFITGLVLYAVITPLRNRNVAGVVVNVTGGGVIALCSLILMNAGLGDNVDKVIIGSLMPLLPGVTMTNAIRDVLGGDYLSGTTRAVDAVIAAVALAAGAGTVLKIWFVNFGGVII